MRELFARMCFNAAVSNLDDHPRNHAVLAKGRNWRLSPAYDLTPSPVISQERRDLAMACGLQGRLASKGNLLSGHGRFLLSREAAERMFADIIRTVRSEWRTIMESVGVSDRDRTRIAGAFLYPGLLPREQSFVMKVSPSSRRLGRGWRLGWLMGATSAAQPQ